MVRFFSRGSIRVENRYPVALTIHQLWLVSLGAPVSRDDRASRTTLYPYRHLDDARARDWLAEQWELTTPQLVRDRLDNLALTGYRARAERQLGISPLAWDLALYTDVTRNAFAAGFLDEPTAWSLLHRIGPEARARYRSWHEYADHYLLGRKVWTDLLRGTPDADFPAPQSTSDAHLRRLLDPANATSPWNLAPWHAVDHPTARWSGEGRHCYVPGPWPCSDAHVPARS